jgi:DNA-binding SARP family transcriptional activator
MAALRLQLLEGFALENSHGSIELPVGLRRLLAFLALKGPAHRCVVAGNLWPEVTDAQALASLRTGLWRMNRVLPGAIRVVEGVALAPSQRISVDSREQEEFTTRLLRDRVDDYGSIMDGLASLWPGQLLPGWYEDWVVFERERLAQLRLHALERLATVMTRGHHLDAALQLALEAVHSEPLRETANAVLMEVYLAEGNVSSAIHQYGLFRELLKRELGLEPSPTLERMLPIQSRR